MWHSGTLNPAEQARQQAALRSRWSLQMGILLVILRLEAISRTQRSTSKENPPRGGGFSFGADGGTLNPAEQARQQAVIRSRWSL